MTLEHEKKKVIMEGRGWCMPAKKRLLESNNWKVAVLHTRWKEYSYLSSPKKFDLYNWRNKSNDDVINWNNILFLEWLSLKAVVSRKNLKVDADFSSFLRRIQKDDDDGSFCQTTMHLRRREGKEELLLLLLFFIKWCHKDHFLTHAFSIPFIKAKR